MSNLLYFANSPRKEFTTSPFLCTCLEIKLLEVSVIFFFFFPLLQHFEYGGCRKITDTGLWIGTKVTGSELMTQLIHGRLYAFETLDDL